jgi:aspartate aminotransferase-like enzyme
MSGKRYLLTPGPTPVPPEVYAAMSEPMIAHRTSEFRAILVATLERLQQVFRTSQDVVLFTASGTAAMESAVANTCSPGDRVVVVSAGNFGERWVNLASAYGLDADVIRYEWGETPSADDLASRLRELGGAKAVFVTHSETSTGVVSDVEALTAAAHEGGALSIVDAVSSLGAVPLETEEWGVDVVATGSQKALMAPPGLAMASVSPAAAEAAARSTSPSFYLNWERYQKAQAKPDAAFTPAVSLILGLNVALRLILETGLEETFDRHVRLGRACRAGVKAMGLELFSPDEDRSAVVTAIRMPDGIDGQEISATVRKQMGVTLAGGQGDLRGKIIRVGHIGYVDIFDIVTGLAATELALVEAGADVERGSGPAAALETFEHTRV